MGAPTLSAIEGWDTEHLESAARAWNATAQHWEDTFDAVHRGSLNPGGTVWEGEGAVAAQHRTFADLVKVRGLSDHLYEAAEIARRGADRLDYLQRAALDAVDEARRAGFDVGEDLSVSDRSLVPLGPAFAARQAQAQALAADIRIRAAALSAADHEVAANITAATAPLSEVAFQEEPAAKNTSDGQTRKDSPTNAIQAVDYKKAPAPKDPADNGDNDAEEHKYGGDWKKSFGSKISDVDKPNIWTQGDVVDQWGHPTDPHEYRPPIQGKYEYNTGTGHATGDYGLHGPTAKGEAYFNNSTDGVSGKAGAEAYLFKGEGTWASPSKSLTAEGQATPLTLKTGLGAAITNHGVYGGLDAFAGAKAEGSATWNLGPLHLGLGGGAEYGVGVQEHLGIGFQNDRFVLGGDVGAAWGPGAKISPRVSIDAKPVFEAMTHAVQWIDGLLK
jgi:hypothetical protein